MAKIYTGLEKDRLPCHILMLRGGGESAMVAKNKDGRQNAPEKSLSATFWGTRGTYPVATADALAFGGNTLCVEIKVGSRQFIIDAGTGIIPLGHTMKLRQQERIDLLFSHMHLDHIEGLPFFSPLADAKANIHFYCGNLDGASPEAILSDVFRPPVFPLPVQSFASSVFFHGFEAGETLDFSGITIKTIRLNHPSGATGYRFEAGGAAIVLAFDVEHSGEAPDDALTAFCAGADILVYDITYDAQDYKNAIGWGHSTPEAAALLAQAAGVGQLIGIHHNPLYHEGRLQTLEAHLAKLYPRAILAREGMVVTAR
jgi:phosphoribosyl 1,2-cyclic phosphodiesterase